MFKDWNQHCPTSGYHGEGELSFTSCFPTDVRKRTQLASIGPRFYATAKEKITPLVERYYGFQTSKAAESLGHNIELAKALKTDAAFSNGDEEHALPYRHRIIQQGINIIWFNDRSSDGVVFSNVFNPMPYEAIALMLAVVRHLSMADEQYRWRFVQMLTDRVLHRRVE
jgi:Domain of unknown function (DUF6532)